MINPTRRLKFSSAMPKKVKWGVAGCGHYAETSFLPALLSVQRSKLVSVFSHDINRAKSTASKFGVPNAYDNFDSFLLSDINTVYISGATADHYDQVIKAAKASKNILCEVPLALSSHQAEEMIEICNQNKVLLFLNYLHRFHPHILKAKELIDKHMLGKIVSISASYNIDYAPDHKFRFNKELSGGGALRYLGSQMIDMLRFFGGEIEQTKAFIDNVVYKSEVEDFATGIVKFKDNGYGYFSVSYNSKTAHNRVEILGCNGSISIEDFHSKKNVATELIIDLEGEGRKIFRKRTNKLVFMIRDIQKTIIKKTNPRTKSYDDVVNLRIIEEIEKQCNL
jgi:predicted dehydrogenase